MEPFIPERLPLQQIAWEPLIPLMGKVNRALARYDGLLQGIPNPSILLSPLITQEAVLSSKIEGTRATLGDVLQFDAGEAPVEVERRRDIDEILNYRKALLHAETVVAERGFSLSLLRDLHAILLDSVRGEDKKPGLVRTTQNWIGPPGSTMEQALFVPPQPLLLPEFLENWVDFYRSEQPDFFVQLAVIHAQFEILHPFNDGNGRLGRMLVPLFLFERGVLSRPAFYLSAYFEKHREAYATGLRQLGTEPGAWNRWIDFFLQAVHEQARGDTEKVLAIMRLYERLKEELPALTHSQYAMPLLDRIFRQPILQARHLAGDPAMPSRPMITNLLAKLKQAGILISLRPGSGRRGEVLAFAELLTLCEA